MTKDQARILCKDYRDIPTGEKFNKISCLEMAEHVGIRHYSKFLKEVYDLLDDDGVMVFQVAGIRTNWQFEDLVWGLLYVFALYLRDVPMTCNASEGKRTRKEEEDSEAGQEYHGWSHLGCRLVLIRQHEQVRIPRCGRLAPPRMGHHSGMSPNLTSFPRTLRVF